MPGVSTKREPETLGFSKDLRREQCVQCIQYGHRTAPGTIAR